MQAPDHLCGGGTADSRAQTGQDSSEMRGDRGRPARLVIYAALRDTDQAITWLERGASERFNPGVLLRPGFDPIRNAPRFVDLIRRIGLPAAPRGLPASPQ